jgi:hypothetical protein
MFVDCDVPEVLIHLPFLHTCYLFYHLHSIIYLFIYLMQGGEGGPVVGTGGSTIGMVYIDGPGAVIISISIICTFFEMWKQFRYIIFFHQF